MRLCDDTLDPIERAAADEQDIGGINLDKLLMRMFAAALRRDVGRRTLQDLQKRLLHALAATHPG